MNKICCPLCNKWWWDISMVTGIHCCKRAQCVACWRYDRALLELSTKGELRGNDCNSCARELLEGP